MNANRMAKAFRSIYSPRYIVLNICILAIYYVLVQKIIALQQFGIVFYAAPMYLIYLLVVSTSILMTISIYTIANSRKKGLGFEAAGASGVCTIAAGVVSGCGCQGAILYSILALLLGSGEAYLVNTVLAENIGTLLGALIVFNIAFIVYSLSKIRVKA